jgi:antitoxin component of RelBE/YafQ-DinJ toxin-antitoxin module
MKQNVVFSKMTQQFKKIKNIEYKTLSLRVEKTKANNLEKVCKELGTYTSNVLDTFITQYLE